MTAFDFMRSLDRIVETLQIDVPAWRRLEIATEAKAVAWQYLYAQLRDEAGAAWSMTDPDLSEVILRRASAALEARAAA